MVQGVIIKALSGFYYVAAGDQIVECKARGRFRYDGCSPLVGDRVQLSFDAHGKGRIDAVEQRRNAFIRPAVANIDQLIMIGANVNPITDPILIDSVVAIAENAGCEPVQSDHGSVSDRPRGRYRGKRGLRASRLPQ